MYSYTPLKTSASFRLVHILPNTNEHTLHLNMAEESLNDAGDYQALSYEWQGLIGTCPVAVGNDEILVTPNLYAALKMLRSENEANRIWIDAICINQNDLGERSSHVEKMKEIYEGTSQVVYLILSI
jgi:Heterokaryon incompatibility protein (HET)